MLNLIIAALQDLDGEVRYLAVRTLEDIGKNSPPVIEAMRGALNDENLMVRNAARRGLLQIAPEAIRSGDGKPATKQ